MTKWLINPPGLDPRFNLGHGCQRGLTNNRFPEGPRPGTIVPRLSRLPRGASPLVGLCVICRSPWRVMKCGRIQI